MQLNTGIELTDTFTKESPLQHLDKREDDGPRRRMQTWDSPLAREAILGHGGAAPILVVLRSVTQFFK